MQKLEPLASLLGAICTQSNALVKIVSVRADIHPVDWACISSLIVLLPVLLSAQKVSGSASMPVIDMHFHTMWLGPNMTSRRTGFPSGETPEEMHRRNLAALDRNHIVKAVASGDQLPLYAELVGGRFLPGIILPSVGEKLAVETLDVSPAALRQMHKEGKLAALAEFCPQYLGLEPASPKLEPYWARSYLGPCIAEDPETARQLLTPVLNAVPESGWFWDLLVENRDAMALASALGFKPVRRLVRMSLGPPLREREEKIYALAGFEFG